MPDTTQTVDISTDPIANTSSPIAIAAVHVSFVHRFEAEFKKIFSRTNNFTSVAASTMTLLSPAIILLVTFAAPQAAPATTLLVSKIQAGFAAASAVIQGSGPAPTVLTYLNSVLQDVQQLESALQIKDPATQAKVTAAVQLIVGEINALTRVAIA